MAAAYIVPFLLYLLGTGFVGRFDGTQYAVGYIVAAVLISVVTIVLHRIARGRGDVAFRPHSNIVIGILFGVVGIVLWILISGLHLESKLTSLLPQFLQPGQRESFNPFEELSGPVLYLFLTMRLIGIAALVPVIEEVFWRGFLMRWLIDPDWRKVPVGEYSLSSCALIVALFTLAHPEWFAAATYALLTNVLLYWKKDLWLCIVAHATSNLLLAVYVVAFSQWWLW